MTATLTPANQAQAVPAELVGSDDEHSQEAEAEERRWARPLIFAFAWAAAFFAAAIGTGRLWLMVPAGLGIGMIILDFVYLGLSSDTNATA